MGRRAGVAFRRPLSAKYGALAVGNHRDFHDAILPESIRVEELRAEGDGLRALAADLPLIEHFVRTRSALPSRRSVAALAVVERDQNRRHWLPRMRVGHDKHRPLVRG